MPESLIPNTQYLNTRLAYLWIDIDTLSLKLLWRAPVLEQSEALWNTFLEGYTDRRSLSSADLKSLTLFAAMRPIWSIGTLLQTMHQNWNLEAWDRSLERPLPIPAFFDQALEFLRAWDQKYLSSRASL